MNYCVYDIFSEFIVHLTVQHSALGRFVPRAPLLAGWLTDYDYDYDNNDYTYQQRSSPVSHAHGVVPCYIIFSIYIGYIK